ncbi:MAG: LLM class flavin-dependent oxidoreductase [Pseudomonadota bacterium]
MKFGIAADFRNPVKWRRPFPDLYQEVLDQMVLAESLGFHNCWLTEHHFTEDGYNPSLLGAASAIAARTKTIRIGSFILLLPFLHPVRAAEDVALVDIISNGRFDFGVGQGYSFHEFNGFCIDRATRGARYRESMSIIKQLFTEEQVSFDGEFTQIKDVRLSPKPVQQPYPPIWVGARGPKAIKRAARDGHNLIATFGKDPAPLYVETQK